MMTNNTDTKTDTIIDLDADQVIDHEESPSTTSKAPTASPKSRNRNWLYGVAAIAIAAVGGGWVYKDLLSSYFPPDHVKVLTEKITVLEGKNAALLDQLSSVEKLTTQLTSDMDALEGKEQALSSLAEASQKAVSDNAAKFQQLEKTLAETKQTIADVSSRPVVGTTGVAVDASLLRRLSDLEKDVAALKVKPAEPVDNTVALSQNLSDLKAKIAAGAGYRDEYERIQRMVPAAAGLEVLEQHASLGLPDAKGLGAELKSLIAALPKPIVPGPVAESEGWWAGIYESLSDLITIKIEGDVDWPTTASAAVAFADSGDLAQAIDHLNAVEVAKPAGIQQWLERAQARLAVEKAAQSVEEAVLRVIAAKG
jgi:hypothetical protein